MGPGAGGAPTFFAAAARTFKNNSAARTPLMLLYVSNKNEYVEQCEVDFGWETGKTRRGAAASRDGAQVTSDGRARGGFIYRNRVDL